MTEDELSYGKKIAAESTLTIYCAPCDRKIEFDPTELVEGKRPLGARFRCSICHEYGLCIIIPKWRHNTFGEEIPYGSSARLSDDFYGNGRFIGPPREPVLKRRRKRR